MTMNPRAPEPTAKEQIANAARRAFTAKNVVAFTVGYWAAMLIQYIAR